MTNLSFEFSKLLVEFGCYGGSLIAKNNVCGVSI